MENQDKELYQEQDNNIWLQILNQKDLSIKIILISTMQRCLNYVFDHSAQAEKENILRTKQRHHSHWALDPSV